MIKISVIIPIYNGEKFISKCIDNVLEQSLKEIEIILIDDCSTDKTPEILKAYQSKQNIKIITNKHNLGPAISRNLGLELAAGEYIHFLDSDDLLKNNLVYLNLYDYAEKNQVDIVVFDCEKRNFITNDLIKIISWEVPKNKIMSTIEEKTVCLSQRIFVWNKIYKSSFIKEKNIKFLSQITDEDRYFHWISIIKCSSIIVYPMICYIYMERENSLSHTETNYGRFHHIIIASESIKNFLIEESYFDNYKIVFVLFYLKRYCRDFRRNNERSLELFHKISDLVSWIKIEEYKDYISYMRYIRYKYLINKNYIRFNLLNFNFEKTFKVHK